MSFLSGSCGPHRDFPYGPFNTASTKKYEIDVSLPSRALFVASCHAHLRGDKSRKALVWSTTPILVGVETGCAAHHSAIMLVA
jgi:hypothetical protein